VCVCVCVCICRTWRRLGRTHTRLSVVSSRVVSSVVCVTRGVAGNQRLMRRSFHHTHLIRLALCYPQSIRAAHQHSELAASPTNAWIPLHTGACE
jgi:hypothetical protein